jgi:uncharacterized protein (DUF983 family)
MKVSSGKSTKIMSIFKEKCPNCDEGHVFKQNVGFFQLPVMVDACEECGYRFDREPGYFLGAMYISYGLAAFQGILTFFCCYFFIPSLSTLGQSIAVITVILLFGKKNYKLSRILYIHLFPW